MEVKEISVLNLKCGGCVNTVKKGLSTIDGVDRVEVDLDTSTILVGISDENIISLVKEKLSTLGYPEENEKNSLIHKAKSMVSCSMGKFSSNA